ncbi:tyrosine-type recombinase/integrase [Planococcus versutus]|uniref:Site-specific integrase n=1 Tax=Planococcus versutus TaxID=1302659 RepID=A0A1B1S5G8_9BACL|nr:site-specific integrase [Planococcus versutus]ANU28409.1 site-specific integrase [Planococcus versutus]
MKCRKLPNNKWECYEEGPRDPVTNKRNAIRKQATKKSSAQLKVQMAIDALESGIDTKKANRVTFEEIAWEWYNVYSVTGIKNSTMRTRVHAIKVLSKYIGETLINRVTHGHLQNILIDLDKRGYSSSLLNGVKVTANFVFKHAIIHRLRKDNPATGLIIPKRRMTVAEIESEEIKEKYFESEDLKKFLKAAIDNGLPNDKEWFYLMAFTGMRVGEVCALKWSDVDFKEKTIRVTKTLDNPNGRMYTYELTPPKTKKSIRIIEVDDDLLDILKSHKSRQLKTRMKFRKQFEKYDEGNFVFARENGFPFYSRLVYTRTIRLCKLAELKKVEGPHIIRHTYITMLAEAGVDLQTIMQRVGHEDSKTTTSIYMHITKAMKKNATDQVHHHFGNLFRMNL